MSDLVGEVTLADQALECSRLPTLKARWAMWPCSHMSKCRSRNDYRNLNMSDKMLP